MTSDPFVLHTIQKLAIIFGGMLCIYLGYRLFVIGIDKTPGYLEGKSHGIKIILSGQGPGLFFMVLGAAILIFALYTTRVQKIEYGNSVTHTTEEPPPSPGSVDM